MDETQWKLEQLKRVDEARFHGRAERASRTKVHGVIPNHFFSAASSECRELFIDGHYYGCISLAQAVAEGLTRFLGDFHNLGARKNPSQRAVKLYKATAITKGTLDAFNLVRGNDRNTFHHINPDILTDQSELEQRAEGCVNALYQIESQVFGFEIANGAIVPKNPAYWPKSGTEHAEVFLRLSH